MESALAPIPPRYGLRIATEEIDSALVETICRQANRLPDQWTVCSGRQAWQRFVKRRRRVHFVSVGVIAFVPSLTAWENWSEWVDGIGAT